MREPAGAGASAAPSARDPGTGRAAQPAPAARDAHRPAITLLDHSVAENWNAFENAWTELIVAEATEIEPVLSVLEYAGHRKQMARCTSLVREHADALAAAERHDEAARLLGLALVGGANPAEVSGALLRSTEAAYSEHPWWTLLTELTGLHESSADLRESWRAFAKLVDLEKGAAIYHAKGWGVGVVESIDEKAQEIRVRFASGRRDDFPLKTFIEIFEVLEDEDPRSLFARDPEGFRKQLQKEPLEILRLALRRYGGRSTQSVLKTYFAQVALDGSAFTAWWRKARKQAETSSWFEITGSGPSTQIRLLTSESDPVEGMRRQLRRARDLAEALTRVRNLLQGGGLDDRMRDAALDTLAEVADADTGPIGTRMSAWQLLRDERGQTPARLAALLQRAAEAPAPETPGEPPALWQLFGEFSSLRDQERCVDYLKEIHGEELWIEQAIENLNHAPPGMARALVEGLRAGGRGDLIVQQYGGLLARPQRNPALLVALAQHIEKRGLTGDLPSDTARLSALLSLAAYLRRFPSSDQAMLRTRTRLASLLTEGDPPLLVALMQGSKRATLRGLAQIIDEIEGPIASLFNRTAVEIDPGIFREDERPFWQQEALWTTRAGLNRRQAELRELHEIKIPENAEAIGRAASFGDLSENAEWEAALEEQRKLTSRAASIEDELRTVRLIEDALRPENTVCPGMSVTYRELQPTGEPGRERRVRILGPWDLDEQDVLSYRAPLAAGMLGLHPGEKARITLPTGEIQVEVLAVEPLAL